MPHQLSNAPSGDAMTSGKCSWRQRVECKQLRCLWVAFCRCCLAVSGGCSVMSRVERGAPEMGMRISN